MKKKSKILIVFLLAFFAVIESVFAARAEDYDNYCKYTFNDNDGKAGVIYAYPENNKTEFTLKNIEFEFDGKGNHTIGASGETTSRNTNLFVVEDNKLYCPTKAYFCYDDTTNAISTSASDDDQKCPTLTISEDKGDQTERYDPKESDGVLEGCLSGGTSNYQTLVDKLNEVEENVNNLGKDTSKETFKEKIEELSEIDYKKYCDQSQYENFENRIKSVTSRINQKISESNLTTEEKTELQEATNKVALGLINNVDIDVPFIDTIPTCTELLDEDLKSVIEFLLKAVRIGVPILLIVLVTIDFSQVVISNDQDAIKKAVNKAVKRGIAALAFFFVPLFVSIMLDWLVIYNDTDGTGKGNLGLRKDSISCEEVLK